MLRFCLYSVTHMFTSIPATSPLMGLDSVTSPLHSLIIFSPYFHSSNLTMCKNLISQPTHTYMLLVLHYSLY